MGIVILIVPVVLIICGSLMLFRPPKQINRYSGYRTKNSMRDRESWDFAQKYCGKLWLCGGAAMLLVSGLLLFLLPELKKNIGFSLLCVFLQVALMCLSYFQVERALKERKRGD